MHTDDKPPFFRSWKHLYLAVFFNLVVLIMLLYWFSVSFG
jgi:hypothetical protein